MYQLFFGKHQNFRIIAEKSEVHDAWLRNESNAHREQDPVKILKTLNSLLKSIEVKLSWDLTVSMTGQMHGVILWNGCDLTDGQCREN